MTGRGRLAALFRKELIQFLRARTMLALILFLYTGEVIMCTYAMSFDVRNLPTVFADLARSAESRALVQDFGASGYFKITRTAATDAEVAAVLYCGKALAASVFYPFTISPEIAALAMSGSSALVAVNALLLKRTRLEAIRRFTAVSTGQSVEARA
jgi:hypothetical protein